MTKKQKEWLIKIETEIRAMFPGDPMEDDDQAKALLEQADCILEAAHKNKIVERWLSEILTGYKNRHNILHECGKTDREWLNTYMDKYGTKGVI